MFARRQQGAVAVFAAIWLIAGLIVVGLAVDLGQLYLTQRSMQRVDRLPDVIIRLASSEGDRGTILCTCCNIREACHFICAVSV